MTLTSLALAVIMLLLVPGTAGTLWAFFEDYNRPYPLMDYTPQEIGIYDTVYEKLHESDCRDCHGNNLADRHHLTDKVVLYGQCTACHDLIPYAPYVIAIRDCLTSGCHSADDLDTNGWHHDTDLSGSDSCTACHNPNLIAEITPIRDPETYPPSVITPTPFSCENCHWEQRVKAAAAGFNPNTSPTKHAGHPSTYDHYDQHGNPVGYHEYSKPIYGNMYAHHMGFEGNVAIDCYICHALDPDDPDWAPDNLKLIRACEVCHTPESLHSILPHVSEANGWQAGGFHTSSEKSDPTKDVEPTVYTTFSTNQTCFACHGKGPSDPPPSDPCAGGTPFIDTTIEGILPKYSACGGVVTLRGTNFGEEHIEGRKVQMKLKGIGNPWIDVPIASWTDTRIEFHIPCMVFEVGNHKVRVKTECDNSNKVILGLKDWVTVTSVSPDSGACGQWITIRGDSFGNEQSKMFPDGYHGISRIVEVGSPQGTFTATRHKDWANKRIKARFTRFFEDLENPNTGNRNFVQDDGTGNCPQEPTTTKCDSLALGTWSITVKAIYYGDEDGSGDLSCGDTVFQVTLGEPGQYDLTNAPIVYKLSPRQIERYQILRIYGLNFGPAQTGAEVRIGTAKQADDPLSGQGKLLDIIRAWSNTRIKVKVKVRLMWEGKTKYVWVERDDFKSNHKKLQILEPLP